MIALCILLAVALLAVIFFSIPYSPLKNAFRSDAEKLMQAYITEQKTVITEEEVKNLPAPVQKHFRYSGFVGAPKMTAMKAEFKNVAFRQNQNGPNLTINYTQYNFVTKPQRLAFIKSSLFAVPFDGYDSFINGKGGMRGVVGKFVTIFNQKGPDMDKASLVTFLSECLLLPSAALQKYITWIPVDETHTKAVINAYGITVQGVFTFGPHGEMLSFSTEDRAMCNTDGSCRYVRWTAQCGGYHMHNGRMVPMSTQAVWNLPEGDFVYFDSDNTSIDYY